MLLEPDNLDYPSADERFSAHPSEMTLGQCSLWLVEAPPEPVFNVAMKEQYTAFIARQSAYAAYRNEVSARRDSLKLEEQKLSLPATPFGDDIRAAIEWVQTTGETPIEFLTKTYRNSQNPLNFRIVAASKVMDYVHRRLPATVDLKAQPLGVKALNLRGVSALTEAELETLEHILAKLSPADAK